MIILKLLRWLFGYVVFQAKGMFPERFINLAARSDIALWNVKSSQGAMQACVAKSNYRALRPMARKAQLRLRVKQRRGLPFKLRVFHGRMGMVVGAAAFFLILQILSMFVWDVRVNGNVNLTETQVQQVMSELGVGPGTLKKGIDAKLLEQSVMVRLPEISWCAVNLQGSEVTVELKEKDDKPEMIPVDQPCNIKAACAGQIVRMEIYDGTAAVMEGEAVVPGQLLVNGVVEDKYGNSVFQHASAKIFASTKRSLQVEVPLEQTVPVPTGKTIVRRRIALFGVEFPISAALIPDDSYTCARTSEPLIIGQSRLPVRIYTETWTQQIGEQRSYTEEQAAALAREELAKKEEQELSALKIVGKTENGFVKDGVYHLEVRYDCEEDIAVESPILVN